MKTLLPLVCCFAIMVCGLTEAMMEDFCEGSYHVVFITDKNTPDHTTFSAQRNFLLGLTQRFTNPHTKISLVLFDREVWGRFMFLSVFRNVTNTNFTADLLYGRPRPMETIYNAADLFPWNVDYHFLNRGVLIVSLDVQLPQTFYLKPYKYAHTSTTFGTSNIYYMALYNVYEIFTDGFRDIQFNRRYLLYATHEIHGTITVHCRDIQMFQYSFQMLYDEICEFGGTAQPKLERSDSSFQLFQCDISNCSLSINYLRRFTITNFKFNQTRWTFVKQILGNDIRKTCSMEGMVPFTVRNKKEVGLIGNSLVALFSSISPFEAVLIKFGLVRRRNTVGRRFSWLNGKDLSFSYWASDEEPEGGDKFGCAHWTIDLVNQAEYGWSSVGCGNAVPEFVFCHDEPPSKMETLKITQNKPSNAVMGDEPNNYGEIIYFEGNQEKRIITSVSSAIASGLLYEKLRESDYLLIKGYVHNELLTISHENSESFIAEPGNLYHLCDSGSSFHGVPHSQVCDGIKDCDTGSDETECEMTGYPACLIGEFQCTSGQCVSLEAKCDLIRDCLDGSDEEDCRMEDCQHRHCHTGRCLPRSWFQDGQVDCSDGSDELALEKVPCVFICNRTQCVTTEKLNDGVRDCKGPEGPLDETLGALESFNCPQRGKRSFINNWAPRCVLFHDNFKEIIGCRDFSHLENCDDFVCPPGHAKCPDSFCIPIAYLNDGKSDCDYGEDEGTQLLENPTDLFKCHPQRSQYVTLSSVCDGKQDCFNGEDELDCHWTCSSGFICLAGAISATRYRPDKPPSDWSFISPKTRYLDFSGVQVPKFFKMYPKKHFNFLLFLNLSRCGIDNILFRDNLITTSLKSKSISEDFQAVRTLDLSHNKIVSVEYNSVLRSTYRLKTLDLSHNEKLTQFGTFFHMIYLNNIDLSFTSIVHLQRNAFLHLRSLKRISLKQTRVTSIDFILPATLNYFNVELTAIQSVGRDVFSKTGPSLNKILSSTFRVCCPAVLGPSIPRHFCHHPASEVVFSCENLVEEKLLRAVLWLIGFATLAGNIVTLVYRLTWDRKLLLKSYGLFVTNLGVSDTLMGCYLAIIAVADMTFQGEYVLHDHGWRTSAACWSAGTIATLSSITSTLFVFLITVDRYLVVRYPFGEVRFGKHTMMAAVSGVWVLGISLAALPLLPFSEKWDIYSTNGMCLGLPLSPERFPGWQYTVFLFVGLNFVLFIFIGVGQVAIYKTVRESQRKTTKRVSRKSLLFQNKQREEIAIAKKLALVVISNFICWCPIITMGLVTLFGVDVGATAYRWSAVLILPINSALNPLLYTLPAIQTRLNFYRETRKSIKTSTRKTKKTDATPTRRLKPLWCRKRHTLERMRISLEQNAGYKIWTPSQLEALYKKMRDLQAAC